MDNGSGQRPVAHRSWAKNKPRPIETHAKPGIAVSSFPQPKHEIAFLEQQHASGDGEATRSSEHRRPAAARGCVDKEKRREIDRDKEEEERKKRARGEGNHRPKSSSMKMLEMDLARAKKERSGSLVVAATRNRWAAASPSSSSGKITARQAVKQALEKFVTLWARHQDKHRPDLQAMREMRLKNELVNRDFKDSGHVPGVELFDIFSFRVELFIVGLHNHPKAGICFSKTVSSCFGIPIATSIVISGGYKDNRDNGDEFEYTGSGGNNANASKGKAADQELKRGNLALVNSVKHRVPVRVIRGIDTPGKRREFRYDGLYNAVSVSKIRGLNDCQVFKFFMRRCPDQPPLPGEASRNKNKRWR